MIRWLLLAAACILASCGAANAGKPQPPAVGQDVAVSRLAAYGRELILHTRKYLRPYVTANMDCAACHLAGGTKARGGSFVGIAAQFPQWNKRAHRVISLQDRLAECFLYSMNGRPPPYASREMEAMVAYITSLSRGTPIGSKLNPSQIMASISLPHPSLARGAALFSQRCSMCHGANGSGNAVFPPLWGPASFNNGAGMHRLRTMAGFVRYNMPQNAPGSLSDRDAVDVAAFVLSHTRPKFDGSKLVTFPPQPASYF
jgi:thiosulfate dehydrogenase